jgi:hypothetical protein
MILGNRWFGLQGCNRLQELLARSHRETELAQVGLREIWQNLKIDLVFGESPRVLT